MRIVVVAGSYEEYRNWCRRNDEVPGGRCKYVYAPHQLYGDSEVAYVLTGSYHSQPHWWRINRMLKRMGAIPVGPPDETEELS